MIHLSEQWLIGFLCGLFFAASVGVLVMFYMALGYAARHLRAALLKADDVPCSAAQHERQAKLALQLGRIPSHDESMDWASEAPRDPNEWPCSFSYHEHASRADAVECARKRLTNVTVDPPALSVEQENENDPGAGLAADAINTGASPTETASDGPKCPRCGSDKIRRIPELFGAGWRDYCDGCQNIFTRPTLVWSSIQSDIAEIEPRPCAHCGVTGAHASHCEYARFTGGESRGGGVFTVKVGSVSDSSSEPGLERAGALSAEDNSLPVVSQTVEAAKDALMDAVFNYGGAFRSIKESDDACQRVLDARDALILAVSQPFQQEIAELWCVIASLDCTYRDDDAATPCDPNHRCQACHLHARAEQAEAQLTALRSAAPRHREG